MAGRPPKPTALRLVDGNPGKRAAPSNEPEPKLLNQLEPPAHLPEGAAVIWRELAKPLRDAMLLTELDALALEWLCVAAAQHRLATANAPDDKLIARNAETGSLSPSPWLIIQSMAFKRGKLLVDAFGMTPAARSRVSVNPQTDLFPPTGSGPARFFGTAK